MSGLHLVCISMFCECAFCSALSARVGFQSQEVHNRLSVVHRLAKWRQRAHRDSPSLRRSSSQTSSRSGSYISQSRSSTWSRSGSVHAPLLPATLVVP